MPSLDRRSLLSMAAGMAAAPFLAGSAGAVAAGSPRFVDYPFKLGVASGDPLPDGVVIWTRLAPVQLDPAATGSEAIPVDWQVATDSGMRSVVARGTALARPELAHAVHVEVHGLEPGRAYFYRFRSGSEISRIGRTKTAPAPGARADLLRFAHASCQDYTVGYYAAYRDMADQDLDFILHLGDYIYEHPGHRTVRRIAVDEARDLWGYRSLYATYRQDPDLAMAHARAPWLVTWDDHEVDNDYGGAYSTDPYDARGFLKRRAAAYRAFYEHMPLRLRSRPRGAALDLYQQSAFGDLLELTLVDFRQYRDPPACIDEDGLRKWHIDPKTCPAALATDRTGLGAAQEGWLLGRLGAHRARWTALATPTRLSPFDHRAGSGQSVVQDRWDGYPATRKRILDRLRAGGDLNPVALGGDIHAHYAATVHADPMNPDSPPVMADLACSSISSWGGGDGRHRANLTALADNPWTVHYDCRQNGYMLHEVRRSVWLTRMRAVADVRRRDSAVRDQAIALIEPGRPVPQMMG